MTIQVRVNLYSVLRCNRFAEADVVLIEGALVADLLDKLDMPAQDVGIVMVNARSGMFQQKLNSGDRITLIPAIGGG
jgi:sulfur carrier protein ThiS